MKEIKGYLERINDSTIMEMLDITEDVLEAIDNLWKETNKSVYSEERMENLIIILSEEFVRYIQIKLSKYNPWTESFIKIKDLFKYSINICKRWKSDIDMITTKIWANYSPHLWTKKNIKCTTLNIFLRHIKMILDLRTSHEQIIYLLSSEEKNNLKIEQKLDMFKKIDLSICNEYNEQFWDNNESSKNISNEIENIIWAKQISKKLEDNEKFVKKTLNNLSNSQVYIEESHTLLEEIKRYANNYFEKWNKEMEFMMNDPDSELMLKKSGKLMEIDYSDGHLKVNYSDQLVSFLREVRQLTSMGFPVSLKIQKLAEQASQYYRYGVILQQVAQFYNTIDQQMLKFQQPMLLEYTTEFENIIKNPNGNSKGISNKNQISNKITWANPSDLDQYIVKLQRCTEKLTANNRRFRKIHQTIIDEMIELMSISLVKNKAKWKDIIQNIRSQITNVENHYNISPKNTSIWKTHLDYQLYKVLEHHYRMGLESFHDDIPEINVEMIYKQSKIQYKPSFEEIRTKYYHEIKKFVNIPIAFKGFSDNDNLFNGILHNNKKSLNTIYQRAENIFQKLSKAQDLFKDWVIIQNVDIDEIIDNNLETVKDYENNFKMIKNKGKELEQVKNEININNILISTTGIKSAIDNQLQNMYDSLLSGLRRYVTKNGNQIESFVSKGMELLSKRPQTYEEIGEANKYHDDLLKEKKLIQSQMEKVEAKNKLLNSVSGNGIDLSILKAKWDKLELILQSHEVMVKEQVDILRDNIDGRRKSVQSEIDKFANRWTQLKPNMETFEDKESVIDAIKFIKDRQAEFDELKLTIQKLNNDCSIFGVSKFDCTEIENYERELKSETSNWECYESFSKEIGDYLKNDWIGVSNKVYLFEEIITKWSNNLKSSAHNPITVQILKEIDDIRSWIPSLKYIRGDNWLSEHWAEFFRIANIQKTKNIADLTLNDLFEVRENMKENVEKIKELSNRANGEVSIREALQELESWGVSAEFSLSPYEIEIDNNEFGESNETIKKTVMLIKDWKETLTQIGDNQSLLQSLKDSPFYGRFSERCSIWETRFADLDEILHVLNIVQRRWVYLEPIFRRRVLPNEQARFDNINTEFNEIMNYIEQNKCVISILSYNNVKDILEKANDQLERCQKALYEFLEEKRSKFARFYFIGDEDLLEIIGQAKNPRVIESHLKKLFAGVYNVIFNEDTTAIIAMKSLEGEVVHLINPVKITDDIEKWLQDFSDEMKNTLSNILIGCLKVFDVFKYPQQILCLSEALHFTSDCEEAIKKGTLRNLNEKFKKKLDQYTKFDYSTIKDPIERSVVSFKLKALILDTIHNIDIIAQLQENEVKNVDEWIWKKQLRYYLDKNNKCIIKMNNAEFNYTYEYQGNVTKLVHTPLTDKCYLTLTQAMDSGFGGNPYGPAGTGKTESVKALGNLFGRQVLVFNCDEGLDYKSIGRIFIGIMKCGAWGCFDEFNRLDEAVLSAVSQQIQIIQSALKEKNVNVTLLDKQVKLDLNCAIFVTLNPAGKGYGGRQKLPDNLKQLFRSIAMTKPDNELISEVILYSEGFTNAKILGRKIISIFQLCKELLSNQQHYDWGLRSIKAVLQLAGQLLHEEKKKPDYSTNREANILVKAFRVNTLSKLTYSDSHYFNNLVNDVFPGIKYEVILYDELHKAIKESYEELKLVYMDSQVEKIFQFYEACNNRMGVVIVGPSGSGKTTICKVLSHALKKLGKSLKMHILNPKSIDRNFLLGYMDIDTREWTDGILTMAAHQAIKEPKNTQSWIICDGDIDPEWIESLNSVLDDNHLLTIPNGERIQFTSNVNFIFETHDLTYASPATVSRMGMIYMSDENIDIKLLVKAWLDKQDNHVAKIISPFIESYFFKALEWITKNSDASVVKTTKIGNVFNGLSHLSTANSLNKFIFGLIKGFGSNLYQNQRQEFAMILFKLAGIQITDKSNVLDYYIDVKSDSIQHYKFNSYFNHDSASIRDYNSLPVIETVSVQRTVDIIMPWLKKQEPFIFVGPEGAGKQMILRTCFNKLHSVNVVTIHCNSQTKAVHIIRQLHQYCLSISTNQGRALKPKDCERLILYLKDINLPKPDKYNTVELISFLQQLITYHGFYNKSLDWVRIENIQIVASMNPSTSIGRYKLSTRLTSIVHQCYIWPTSINELHQVYCSLLQPIIQECLINNPTWNSSKQIQNLSKTMLIIYDQTCNKFTTSQYMHYKFNPRDLSKWITSLYRYEFKENEVQNQLLDVIVYEAQRLFSDRLVGDDARNTFNNIVFSTIKNEWNYSVNISNIVYVYIKNDESNSKILKRVTLDTYKQMVSDKLLSYENEYRTLDLSLYPEMLFQLAKFENILLQEGGSLLLAGRTGMKRWDSICLVASMLHINIYTLKIGRNYQAKSFYADIKQAIYEAGVQGENTILAIEDNQLINPLFIESINSLLSSGEVPGMYNKEELETIYNEIKDTYSETGFKGSINDFFINRVHCNLHIVLILDCSSQDFTNICEANPAFYSQCRLMWIDAYTQESMKILSKSQLIPDLLENSKNGDKIVKQIIDIHSDCLKYNASPKHFLRFLQCYNKIYKQNKEIFEERKKYLQGGVDKLTEASKYVDTLSQDASRQGILLAEKQKETDSALKQITESMLQASNKKKEMEQLSVELNKEEEKIQAKKKAVEEELKEVGPLLEKAKESVGAIKAENLTEIRSLRAPPPVIRDVLEGVLRLMGIYDMSWTSMKSFLGKRTIKEEIINFDASNITKQIRSSVQELINQKPDSFKEATVKRSFVAAAPLAVWVKANIEYSIVIEKIEPLRSSLEQATRNLTDARNRIQKLKEDVIQVDNKVKALREDFGIKTGEAEVLRVNLEKAKEVISSAQLLLGKLEGEGKRWKSQIKEINESLNSLPKNSLVSSAFVTYLGEHSEDVRNQMVKRWAENNDIKNFSLRKIISTDKEQLLWRAEGLPYDELSIDNAIIIKMSDTYPLIIDPSSQALSWLTKHLEDKKPEVIVQNDENFIRSIELAVRFGKTLIIHEIEEIEPILYSLLKRELIKQGPRYIIQLGDKQVDFNENFQLYLITKKSNFEVPPSTSGHLNIVNFSITKAGLTSQLLGITIQHEKPKLEVEKLNLLKKEEEQKVQLLELEDLLLNKLATSEGNILENKSLIELLNNTKAKSTTITNSLKESQELQKNINNERNKYSLFSNFGSSFFFCIGYLKNINNMYQFSLNNFLRIFESSLNLQFSNNGKNDVGPEVRIKYLTRSLEKMLFNYVSRSMFKQDRLSFALFVIKSMHSRLFQENEWDLFTGQLIPDIEGKQFNIPSWIPKNKITNFKHLQSVCPVFSDQNIFNDVEQWDTWIRTQSCEKAFPEKYTKALSPWQKVLIIQTLRPDRILVALTLFCSGALGVSSLDPPALNIAKLVESETIPTEPILFIITPGADLSQELLEASKKILGPNKFYQVAMGQGQFDIAISRLRSCAEEGSWLFLQNIHLVISWLPTLEKEISILKPHKNFRLWLTSEAHLKFPSSILQCSLKITIEAPPGVKKNLLRTYEGWTPEYIADGSVIRAQSLFSLAWFHAIVQERRMYIPQGWAKFYEFSNTDLRSCAELLDKMCHSDKIPQWEIFRGLLMNAIYGGHLDDDADIEKLDIYIKKFFNDEIFSIGNRSPSKYLSKNIVIPNSNLHADYMNLINSLPESDNPSLFNLPVNINSILQFTQSQQVINKIKLLYHSKNSEKSFNKEKWSKELIPTMQLWKKLTSQDFINQKHNRVSSDNPLIIFFNNEYTFGMNLIKTINKDLINLSKLIRGLILPTNDLMDIGTSLTQSNIPSSWNDIWEGPESSAVYLKEIIRKTGELSKLKNIQNINQLLSLPIDLSNMFRQKAFFNSFRQYISHKINKPLDELHLISSWRGEEISKYVSEEDKGEGNCIVQVKGLLLQGGNFDGKRLSSMSLGESYICEVPVCYISWLPISSSFFSLQTQSRLQIPLYVSSNRSVQLGESGLYVPYDQNKEDMDDWKLSGVAFLIEKAF
ncbi:dynein heavy chain and region D6 of dynein motor-domain-containing protein [Neocallimastix sp. 'constans']